ncbi:hypothetical protein [Amycolatopsis sp. cmx-4-61]|uniref:hypothetical protein n=1 Tax=Amycolatopsis sp. cmx-4-61 TaxID=2790937 RepID=UPI00397E06B5
MTYPTAADQEAELWLRSVAQDAAVQGWRVIPDGSLDTLLTALYGDRQAEALSGFLLAWASRTGSLSVESVLQRMISALTSMGEGVPLETSVKGIVERLVQEGVTRIEDEDALDKLLEEHYGTGWLAARNCLADWVIQEHVVDLPYNLENLISERRKASAPASAGVGAPPVQAGVNVSNVASAQPVAPTVAPDWVFQVAVWLAALPGHLDPSDNVLQQNILHYAMGLSGSDAQATWNGLVTAAPSFGAQAADPIDLITRMHAWGRQRALHTNNPAVPARDPRLTGATGVAPHRGGMPAASGVPATQAAREPQRPVGQLRSTMPAPAITPVDDRAKGPQLRFHNVSGPSAVAEWVRTHLDSEGEPNLSWVNERMKKFTPEQRAILSYIVENKVTVIGDVPPALFAKAHVQKALYQFAVAIGAEQLGKSNERLELFRYLAIERRLIQVSLVAGEKVRKATRKAPPAGADPHSNKKAKVAARPSATLMSRNDPLWVRLAQWVDLNLAEPNPNPEEDGRVLVSALVGWRGQNPEYWAQQLIAWSGSPLPVAVQQLRDWGRKIRAEQAFAAEVDNEAVDMSAAYVDNTSEIKARVLAAISNGANSVAEIMEALNHKKRTTVDQILNELAGEYSLGDTDNAARIGLLRDILRTRGMKLHIEQDGLLHNHVLSPIRREHEILDAIKGGHASLEAVAAATNLAAGTVVLSLGSLARALNIDSRRGDGVDLPTLRIRLIGEMLAAERITY